jgi:hypothetical protein
MVRYPGGLAWQMNLSRNQLRSCPELQRLKEFLYEQTEHVNNVLVIDFSCYSFVYRVYFLGKYQPTR